MNEKDWSILEVSIKTSKGMSNVDLGEDLHIDMYNINDAFLTQPAKYAWWATCYVQAKALADRKKLEVEQYEEYMKKTLVGELDQKVRLYMAECGEKITESKVTSAIYCHEDYKNAQETYFELKHELVNLQKQANVLEIAKESMNQRKDALISLGAQLRQEGVNSDLYLKDLKSSARDVLRRSKE